MFLLPGSSEKEEIRFSSIVKALNNYDLVKKIL